MPIPKYISDMHTNRHPNDNYKIFKNNDNTILYIIIPKSIEYNCKHKKSPMSIKFHLKCSKLLYIIKNNIIAHFQYGFRKEISDTFAAIDLIDQL